MKAATNRWANPHASPRNWKGIRWMRRVGESEVIWSLAVQVNGKTYACQFAVDKANPDWRAWAAPLLLQARLRVRDGARRLREAHS